DGTSGSVSNETLVEISRIEPECIMVLGASVHPDGTPSPMLEDRLETGIELYNRGVAPKLLLTGDNGQIEYNEVEAMKNYAVNAGVPEEDIFLDHAGFSTYDSVYRASYVFGVESMVVVTQEYHLYRTLHGCKKMGIEAVGIGADQEVYAGQEYREIREVLARVKDFVMWLIKPEATFLGEAIPISGSGIVTQ
ncbi:MAG: YdcF family protein, partial [Firmicutes bacterium]|nr:YdcF family protein [Bacillota bacterium]